MWTDLTFLAYVLIAFVGLINLTLFIEELVVRKRASSWFWLFTIITFSVVVIYTQGAYARLLRHVDQNAYLDFMGHWWWSMKAWPLGVAMIASTVIILRRRRRERRRP